MGCGSSKPKQAEAPKVVNEDASWKFSPSIKVEDKNIEQCRDNGTTACCIGKVPVTSIKVKLLPTQQFLFTGLMDMAIATTTPCTTAGIKGHEGVFGCPMQENTVVMNGSPTHYKRSALRNCDVVEYKYENDRIFFKIGTEWDLLYVVGTDKKFVFVCEMCHMHSRCEILEITAAT